MDNKHRNKITYLSFALASLIIIRHSIGIAIYTMPGWLFWGESVLSHLTDLAVPTFFAISGYLFFQNFDYSSLLRKWKTRFFSIVIPFILWNLFGFCFYYFMAKIAGSYMNSAVPTFNFNDVFISTKYNVTWFLLYLIFYIYTIPLLYKLLANRVTGGGIIVVALVLGYLFHNDVILYAVPFLFGAYMGIHCIPLVMREFKKKDIIIAFLFIILSVVTEYQLGFGEGPKMAPIRLLQISAVWVVAEPLAIEGTPKWWFGISFFIYCIHSFILESIEKVFCLALGDTTTGAVLDMVFAPILTLVVVIAIAFCIRKIKWIWALLTGNRGN